MLNLKNYITNKVTIKEALLNEIVSHFTLDTYLNDELIIAQGQKVNHYYFMSSGSVRMTHLKNGEIHTTSLLLVPNFFTDFKALRTNTPAAVGVLSMGPTEVYKIDAMKMEEYFVKYPVWQEFSRKMMEDAYYNVIETHVSNKKMDAKSRYRMMLNKSDSVKQIPIELLATFLNISPVELKIIKSLVQ